MDLVIGGICTFALRLKKYKAELRLENVLRDNRLLHLLHKALLRDISMSRSLATKLLSRTSHRPRMSKVINSRDCPSTLLNRLGDWRYATLENGKVLRTSTFLEQNLNKAAHDSAFAQETLARDIQDRQHNSVCSLLIPAPCCIHALEQGGMLSASAIIAL